MNIRDVLNVTGGRLVCGNEEEVVENFERDSRKIISGGTYVAIKGENFDGNDFYEDAIRNGAKVCILSKEPEDKKGNVVVVDDTIDAIQKLASYKRSLYDIPVVAITGSVGKTSTKDLVASVMSRKYKVLKTEGNLNNFIGLPFTILRLKDEEAMVIEMGMSSLGEISVLTNIAKPTLAVITNIGTSHLATLGSIENILKAKLEILEGLQGNSVVINLDNEMLKNWAKENKDKYNIITYGADNQDARYVAKDIEIFDDRSSYMVEDARAFKLEHDDKVDLYKVTYDDQSEGLINVPVAGRHFISNSLCAVAVGRFFDIPISEIAKGIESVELTKGRMEITTAKCGATVINDAYNANYDSMKAAVEYLQRIENKRKIAVLGDMLNLGELSEELHRGIGDIIKDVDVLITVGNQAKYIAENAKISNIFVCNSNEEAISRIKSIIGSDDVILIKASNALHFKDIAESVKNM